MIPYSKDPIHASRILESPHRYFHVQHLIECQIGEDEISAEGREREGGILYANEVPFLVPPLEQGEERPLHKQVEKKELLSGGGGQIRACLSSTLSAFLWYTANNSLGLRYRGEVIYWVKDSFCFQICTPEGRGEKGRECKFQNKAH